MQNSRYVGDPTFRKYLGKDRAYYVPVDKVNAGDNVLVDTFNPNSAGFGGSTFEIKTTEGLDVVKGPWHGSVPYAVCHASELHFTKVTIVANAVNIPYENWSRIERLYSHEAIERRIRMTGDVLYDEKEMVLGTFYRGNRIAQQLANIRDERLYAHIESDGGSRSFWATPGGDLHPLAHRSGASDKYSDELSTEQGGIVHG